MKIFVYLIVISVSILLLCENPTTIKTYVPDSLILESLVGIWKNNSIAFLPDKSDDSGFQMVYISFESDNTCQCFLTTGLGFQTQYDGIYSINSIKSEINISTEKLTDFTLKIKEQLYLFNYRFVKISNDSVIQNWNYQIDMNYGFKIKNLDSYIELKDLTIADSTLYSIQSQRNLLKYDLNGNVIISN